LVRPAIEEELIANAVMGLEALLVREGQEVAYRLRLRAAKLFSCLEEDPIAVSGVLADAYGVRNTFSHGDQLSPRHRRRLERQYKDMPSLLLRVLDLLRKMIVSVIAIRRGKDDLIYLIDDSLISRPHDTQLQGVLAPVRDLI
jgi:hypothetical protein